MSERCVTRSTTDNVSLLLALQRPEVLLLLRGKDFLYISTESNLSFSLTFRILQSVHQDVLRF
jgi:hypothetical protein